MSSWNNAYVWESNCRLNHHNYCSLHRNHGWVITSWLVDDRPLCELYSGSPLAFLAHLAFSQLLAGTSRDALKACRSSFWWLGLSANSPFAVHHSQTLKSWATFLQCVWNCFWATRWRPFSAISFHFEFFWGLHVPKPPSMGQGPSQAAPYAHLAFPA